MYQLRKLTASCTSNCLLLGSLVSSGRTDDFCVYLSFSLFWLFLTNLNPMFNILDLIHRVGFLAVLHKN
jgi:hypothetical protein